MDDVTLARFMLNFETIRRKYLNCDTDEEKKETSLFKYIEQNGKGMSVLRLHKNGTDETEEYEIAKLLKKII